MNIIKAITSFLSMVILGMMGGQGKIGGKNTRRYGIPAVATAFAISWNGFQWKDLVFLLLIPVLVMGYGPNSQLHDLLFGIEWLIRLVYALLLSLPFLFYGLTRWVICAIMLVIAFQIEAGSLGNVNWFGDILVEDIIRFSAVALSVLLCIIWRKKGA